MSKPFTEAMKKYFKANCGTLPENVVDIEVDAFDDPGQRWSELTYDSPVFRVHIWGLDADGNRTLDRWGNKAPLYQESDSDAGELFLRLLAWEDEQDE